MIAASLVLSTGVDAIPALELATSLASAQDDIDEPSSADSRCAKKRPPSKSRFYPKRRSREGLDGHQALSPIVALQRDSSGCPADMVLIRGSYCVDVYE